MSVPATDDAAYHLKEPSQDGWFSRGARWIRREDDAPAFNVGLTREGEANVSMTAHAPISSGL
jgi:hypothetical protein